MRIASWPLTAGPPAVGGSDALARRTMMVFDVLLMECWLDKHITTSMWRNYPARSRTFAVVNHGEVVWICKMSSREAAQPDEKT